MADRLPSGWPLLDGLYTEPALARPLLILLDPGLRHARANGVQFDERLARHLDALQALAKRHVGGGAIESPAVTWIPVRDAAKAIGVTPQAVRDMTRAKRNPLPSCIEGHLILVDEASVRLRAMNRADAAKHRKASQSPQTRRLAS